MQVLLHIGNHGILDARLRDPLSSGFVQNWAILLEHDVLLPFLHPEAEAHSLANCLHGTPLSSLVETGHDRLLTQQPSSMLRGLYAQIRLMRPKLLIICAPAFYGQAANVAHAAAQALKPVLEGAELHLHATLERPDHHLERLFGHWLGTGYPLQSFSAEADALLAGPHVDYRQIFVPWQEAFPTAKLYVTRCADQPDCAEILAAFGRRFDLPTLAPAPTPDLSASVSAPPRALWEGLRHANALSNEPTDLRAELMEKFSTLTLPKDAAVDLFSLPSRARLHAAFAPVAAALEPHLQGLSFQADLDEILAPRPHPLHSLSPQLAAQLPRLRFGRKTAGLRAVRRALTRARYDKQSDKA